MDGQALHAARERMGERLADEAPAEADVVISVPDSGTPAAQGYARARGMPFADGLVKNRYVGRTFIQPDQALREHGMRLKFNPMPRPHRRASAWWSSTTRSCAARPPARSSQMLRDAGAAEVHLRISSPPIVSPCFYGIDMAERDELIAAGRSVEEIRAHLGADSLAYLSLDGLQRATSARRERFCRACLTGEYPMPVPEAAGDGQAALRARAPPRRRDAAASRCPTRRPASRWTPPRRSSGACAAAVARRARRACWASTAASPACSRRRQRPAARRRHRRRRHEAAAAARGRHACALPASTASRCASTTCSAPAPRPLFFLDYVAVGRLDPERVAELVEGVADGCRQAGCALLGGETAEMPGAVRRATTSTWPASRSASWSATGSSTARAVAAGDALVGLAASGAHSNGFSLVRRLLERARPRRARRARGLLAPTRIYAPRGAALLAAVDVRAHGAHHGRRHRGQPAARAARRPRRARRRPARGPGPAVFAWLAGLGVETRRDAPRLQLRPRVSSRSCPPADVGRGDRGLRGRRLRGVADRRGRARARASRTCVTPA